MCTSKEGTTMRTLWIGCALATLVISLTACGGTSASGASDDSAHQADLFAIEQIEKTWHKSISRKQIDLLMSLWAPNATFTIGPGKTLTGKAQIRRFFLKDSHAFDADTHWVLDTPAYKIRMTANGDKGTLYFECDHIDLDTHKVENVTASDMQVARVNGRWLITNNVGASPTLSP